MYRVKVNGQETKVEIKGEEINLNGQKVAWDIQHIDGRFFHIIRDEKTFRAEIVSADLSSKSFRIKINGRNYELEVLDKFDLLLQQMGMSAQSVRKINSLKAPMPGLVLKIYVEAGQAVSKGDSIMILEAMKMENILKAPADCTIKVVEVKEGDVVDKNQVLVSFG